MYQINLRSQVSKLALLAAQWQAAIAQQLAPRRPSRLRAALAGLASLAALRAMPGAPTESSARHDPRDPCNW